MALSEHQSERMREYVARARSGDPEFAALDRIIRDSGYARVETDQTHRHLVTVDVLAALMGCSVRTLGNLKREGLPTFRPGKGPRPALYDLWAVAEWRRRRDLERFNEEVDPLLVGTSKDSVWLERYRREKAIAARMENARRAGELIEVGRWDAQLRAAFHEMAVGMRDLMDRLGLGEDFRQGWSEVVDRANDAAGRIAEDDNFLSRYYAEAERDGEDRWKEATGEAVGAGAEAVVDGQE